jgi:hypothetical protein
MHKLLQQLSTILVGEQERPLELRELKVEFVKKEQEILRQFKLCKKSGGVIGIYSLALGRGMFLVTVQEIINDKTIIFKTLPVDGCLSSKVLLDLSEISCLCPFNQIYREPREITAFKEAMTDAELSTIQHHN